MRGVNYRKWAEYIHLITKKYLPREAKVLELGSGNCRVAAQLKYKNVIATDISLQMLSHGNSNVKKICCSMESLPFKTKFDLIFSAFDSVNYLLTKKNLLNFFVEVRKILSVDGVLTFDVSMKNNSIGSVQPVMKKHSSNGIDYTHTQWFDEKKSLHYNRFIFNDSNGETITELHAQRIYSFETFFALAEKADLYVVDCLNAFSTNAGNASSKRLQFIYKAA